MIRGEKRKMRRRDYLATDISRIIDFVRLQNKYSVDELSAKTGISKTTIWKISRNIVDWKNIRTETSIRLFEYLYDDLIIWEHETQRNYSSPEMGALTYEEIKNRQEKLKDC